jgi:hypothetical protein
VKRLQQHLAITAMMVSHQPISAQLLLESSGTMTLAAASLRLHQSSLKLLNGRHRLSKLQQQPALLLLLALAQMGCLK